MFMVLSLACRAMSKTVLVPGGFKPRIADRTQEDQEVKTSKYINYKRADVAAGYLQQFITKPLTGVGKQLRIMLS